MRHISLLFFFISIRVAGQSTLYYNQKGEITMPELATHYRIARIDTAARRFVGDIFEYTMNNTLICKFSNDSLETVPDSLRIFLGTKNNFIQAKYIRKRDYYPDLKGFLKPPVTENNTPYLAIVEDPAEFPGGINMLIDFLSANLQYPDSAKNNNVHGKVSVRFTVMPDGTMGNFKVLNGIGYGCDEEALRVMKLLPDWKPAYQRGKPVPVGMVIPITF
ncbi:MAG: energy transducer TonB [Cyclobacteriaceae bacterium]|nr:energy transducer TonB [Cyclobacteriaceae bacterium]